MNYQEIIFDKQHSTFLLNVIFLDIHMRFVEMKNADGKISIGISFPRYSKMGLGNKIRFFAKDSNDLEKLEIKNLVFKDYIYITPILPISESVSYANYFRVQAKTNIKRLARRKAKRSGITLEAALDYYNGFEEKNIDIPFLKLNSSSNGNPFLLFIDKRKANYTDEFLFNCYGLSKDCSVPEF